MAEPPFSVRITYTRPIPNVGQWCLGRPWGPLRHAGTGPILRSRHRKSWSLLATPEFRSKKADVAEHPRAFDHVGLLVNGPPDRAGLPLS